MKIESGQIYHRLVDIEKRKWINQIEYDVNGKQIHFPVLMNNKDIVSLTKDELFLCLHEAEDYVLNIASKTKNLIGKSKINYMLFFKEYEKFRWFLIPEDVEEYLNESELKIKNMKEKDIDIPFKIKQQDYLKIITEINQNTDINLIKEEVLSKNNEIEAEDNDFMPLMLEMGIKDDIKNERNQSSSLFPE